jgi:formylglycine-generating enzyme required for sulfatase activity
VKLKEADAQLMKDKKWGERRWYVNGQGQTFAVIEGPVEFRVGSPPTETERMAESEPPRSVAISRRFAIASKEVTVEQFQRFVRENPQFGVTQNCLDKYSPALDGPMIAVSWFGAAAYCNWLSHQEGLPKDQWCYLPNERGEYDQRMTIPADALRRTGYRMPTDAEWEYACRAGAGTSRYYGLSTDLLQKYAWYQANSQDHAWTCGSCFPNDLGLFDMLGNVYEWCQERQERYQPVRAESSGDDIIYFNMYRLIRGGAFNTLPVLVCSAEGNWDAPSYRDNSNGFRPARTYN